MNSPCKQSFLNCASYALVCLFKGVAEWLYTVNFAADNFSNENLFKKSNKFLNEKSAINGYLRKPRFSVMALIKTNTNLEQGSI